MKKFSITDQVIPYRDPLPINSFHQFCSGVFSQSGEDGIIQQLLKELKITEGWFCEFGAHDGIFCSNTFNLVRQNWSGVAIEANGHKYNQLKENYRSYPKITCINGMVEWTSNERSLDAWLATTKIPIDFDILSIDIDHYDYYVWQSVINYQPKIVVIEVNPYRDPVCEQLPDDQTPKPSYELDYLFYSYRDRIGNGTSMRSMIKLGLLKGYIPVAFTGNLIFIRRDLTAQLKEFPYRISNSDHDYLYLFTDIIYLTDKQGWYTNQQLKYLRLIRDEYLRTGIYQIDLAKLEELMIDNTRA